MTLHHSHSILWVIRIADDFNGVVVLYSVWSIRIEVTTDNRFEYEGDLRILLRVRRDCHE